MNEVVFYVALVALAVGWLAVALADSAGALAVFVALVLVVVAFELHLFQWLFRIMG